MESMVATGRWLYAEECPKQVSIVMLDYDFWYAIGEANGDLAEDERPELNDAGRAYYVRQRPWREGEPFWPDSIQSHSMEEAMAAAEAVIPGPVEWTVLLPARPSVATVADRLGRATRRYLRRKWPR